MIFKSGQAEMAIVEINKRRKRKRESKMLKMSESLGRLIETLGVLDLCSLNRRHVYRDFRWEYMVNVEAFLKGKEFD